MVYLTGGLYGKETNVLLNVSEDYQTSPREDMVRQVRCWGDLNTDAILDPSCQLFQDPSIKGFIGYRVESRCAVVYGDPICPQEDKLALAKSFKKYCERHHLGVLYIMASQEFAKAALKEVGRVLIQFGDRLMLYPEQDLLSRTGSKAVLLRKKVKHARNDGVEVVEYETPDPQIEQEVQAIGAAWLSRRHGAQVYICHLNIFGDREGKRWFYAKKEGRVVGFLLLNQVQGGEGWLLNNLILSADAPSGTSELLITSVIQALQKEGCKWVTVGPIPAKELGEIVGLGTWVHWIVKRLFLFATKVFRLNGQTTFWEKFQADSEPCYVILDRVTPRTLKALLRAVNVNI